MMEYLEHHGVKGQKWGVRRYQNYDGSYTKAGLARYNKALGEYNYQRNRRKSLEKSGADKSKITNAKVAERKAELRVKKDYRHLKEDKRADKGKELYAKGVTIRGQRKVQQILLGVGEITLAAAYGLNNTGDSRYSKAMTVLASIGGVSMASALGVRIGMDSREKKLRAYYNHTSHY